MEMKKNVDARYKLKHSNKKPSPPPPINSYVSSSDRDIHENWCCGWSRLDIRLDRLDMRSNALRIRSIRSRPVLQYGFIPEFRSRGVYTLYAIDSYASLLYSHELNHPSPALLYTHRRLYISQILRLPLPNILFMYQRPTSANFISDRSNTFASSRNTAERSERTFPAHIDACFVSVFFFSVLVLSF